jgi:hypothetical protein
VVSGERGLHIGLNAIAAEEATWNMLATIITEIFEEKDIDDVIDALERLCAPVDPIGWASAGIYAFWDPTTGEILYIGLAVDLSIRFQQHTGRIPVDPATSKVDEIRRYFRANKYLGYSVFLQSPLSQPFNARWRQVYGDVVAREEEEDYEHDDDGLQVVRRAEGILIGDHTLRFGAKPKWNKIQGLQNGLDLGSEVTKLTILKALINLEWTPLTARNTLRGLAANNRHRQYEEWLHGVRLRMSISGEDFPTAFQQSFDFDDLRAEIAASQYCFRRVPSPFQPLRLPLLLAGG